MPRSLRRIPLLLALAAWPAAGAPATPADVAWMAGHWVDDDAGHLSEEIWAAPSGDSMMGMWRYVDAGRVRIFELLTITSEAGGLVLRIRHFDPRLVAREAKGEPVALALVSLKEREAVFEGPETGVKGAVRITYRRPSDDTLVAVLHKEGEAQEFRFQRR